MLSRAETRRQRRRHGQQKQQQRLSEGEGSLDDGDRATDVAAEQSSCRDSECVTVPRSQVLPAYDTKHLEQLQYHLSYLDTTLHLTQSSTTHDTSSSLWLSAQVLAAWLIHETMQQQAATAREVAPRAVIDRRPLAVELGAGTGFLSLVLAHCGWSVVATDLDRGQEILRANLEANKDSLCAAGNNDVQALSLDWQSDELPSELLSAASKGQTPNLIVATDTLYATDIVEPFFATFDRLLRLGRSGKDGLSPCRGLLAIERRDPGFIDVALEVAERQFGLRLERIDDGKVADVVTRSLQWPPDAWDGVEIWEVRAG